jgi:glycosyltransferase involved in cell wall biosynthesis
MWKILVSCSMLLFCKTAFGELGKFPEVSIVVPVYNAAPYLARALDSVIQQTFGDIEIICVDDCSTDQSLKILREYAQNDSRIVVLENGKNHGTFHSRAVGIRASRGKFIGFMDPDDELFPTIIERAHAVALQTGADIVNFDSIAVGGPRRHFQNFFVGTLEGSEVASSLCEQKFFGILWNKLFTGAPLLWALDQLSPLLEEKICYHSDLPLVAVAVERAKKYVGIGDVGYRYHVNSGVWWKVQKSPRWEILKESNRRSVFLTMAIVLMDRGRSEHMAQLQKFYPAPMLEYIQMLPMDRAIDVFSRYLLGFSGKERLHIAHAMGRRFPGWRKNVHRLWKIFQQVPPWEEPWNSR